MVLVPLSFEQAVGEAQRDQILDGFLTEIVVDAVDTALWKMLGNGIVDHPGRFEIVTDGLFQNDLACSASPLAARNLQMSPYTAAGVAK